MCYDISFTVDIKELADYFPDMVSEQIRINFEALHIIAHLHGDYPVIFENRDDGKLHLKLMEWGCIPYFINDEKGYGNKRAGMLNARSERILDDSKSYWHKIRNRRCLVPVTGFYEHREVKGFKKKVPYFITLKEQKVFFLPALYSVAELADRTTGEMQKRFTYTIVTRAANDLMKQIHNSGANFGRMPLLLPLELSKKWIQSELSLPDYRKILEFEMPAAEMETVPVFSIRTNEERSDGKKKNEFFHWEHLPEIVLQ